MSLTRTRGAVAAPEDELRSETSEDQFVFTGRTRFRLFSSPLSAADEEEQQMVSVCVCVCVDPERTRASEV